MTDAPRNTKEAADFIRKQHTSGSRSWRRLCLSLQRQARGLPAIYPSALAAMNATPTSERITKISGLRRGMVGYSDDPNDSNVAGHIYFIAGWKKGTLKTNPENCLTWSNDVKAAGGVDLVPLSFYLRNWGDDFRFGATWLNGYNFAEFDAAPKPDKGRSLLGDNYRHGIEDIEKALRYHQKRGNTAVVKALQVDLERMRKNLARFGG